MENVVCVSIIVWRRESTLGNWAKAPELGEKGIIQYTL